MARPKLDVNEVWILQEVIPHEGSSVLGVFVDVEVAKKGRGKWKRTPGGEWTTMRSHDDFDAFLSLAKHPVRTK